MCELRERNMYEKSFFLFDKKLFFLQFFRYKIFDKILLFNSNSKSILRVKLMMMILICINRRLSTVAFISFSELRGKAPYYNKVQFTLIKRFSDTYMVELNKSPDTCACPEIVSDFFWIFDNFLIESIFLSRISMLMASMPRVAIEERDIDV